MRYLKLGLMAMVAVLAIIGLLRVADLIAPSDASWLAGRAVGAIVLAVIAGFALSLISTTSTPRGDSTDRPVP